MPNNFAVTSITYNVWDAVFNVETVSNTSCHLWCYYTFITPDKHRSTRNFRGKILPWGAYFCFVAWRIVEQDEPGDTLIHTFTFPSWLQGQTRYITFKGNIAGIASPSVGPIMEYTRPYIISFPATLSSGFIRNRDPVYLTCHDSLLGDYISPPAWAFYTVGQNYFVLNYFIYRLALFFNLSVFPKTFNIVAARIKFKTQSAAVLPFEFVLVSGLSVNEPLILADYGAIGSVTEPFGSVDCLGSDTIHYLDFNTLGLLNIPASNTAIFGLRFNTDIESAPPPGAQLANIYGVTTFDRPYLELAYLPPK